MSRGAIPDLPTPHPIGHLLPALYHADEFAQRFTAGLDEVIAPAFNVLDNIDAYIDPDLAPMDFVEWLASWVGALLDENWPEQRQREFVAETVRLYEWRGTAHGIRELVRIYTGVDPEVIESGGASWSPAPGGDLPGDATPRLLVRARVSDPDSVSVARLEAIVAAAKPAHVPHEIEVVAA